jgi:hypothetical protein
MGEIKHQKLNDMKSKLFSIATLPLLLISVVLIVKPSLAQVNLQQGLVAYYPFNGNANDESGNGNHGVVYGATLTEDRFGNGNSAYYMNGSSYINIGNLPELNSANGITISVWVKRHTSGRHEGFIGKWNSRGYDNNVFLLYNSEQTNVNKCGMCIHYQGNQMGYVLPGNTIINPNNWYNVIGVWDNSNGFVAIYKNGIIDSESYYLESVGKQINYNTSFPAIIGNWGVFHGPDYFLIGDIDDIRIYNRALNEQEVYALYTEGQPPQTNTISNILINQRNDGSGMVDVHFNLYGTGNQFNITLEASFDGGSTYTAIPASFLSGDVSNISPGTNKHIVWDGLGSHPNTYSAATKLKIIAN